MIGDDLLEFMRETIAADNYRDLAVRLINATAKKLNADIATLWRAVKDDNKQRLILAAAYNAEFLPVEREITYDILQEKTPNNQIKGLTAWMAIKRKPVIADSPQELNDETKPWAGSWSGSWDDAQFWKGKKFGCLIGYPITLEGELLGVIKFERYSDSEVFSSDAKEKVEIWSNMIALTLSGMIFREEQERKRQTALRDLSSKLLVPSSSTYYEDIITLTAQLLNADISTLWLADEKKRKLTLAAQYGLLREAIEKAPSYEIPEKVVLSDKDIQGVTAWTFIRNRPFYAHNWFRLKEHPSHKGYWDKEQWDGTPDEKFGCLYAVPLVSENKPIGVIKVERRMKPHFQAFNEVERATFDLIAVIASVAPPLKAVIRESDELVLDYFHILRAPTANAISVLDSLRTELKKEIINRERVNVRINMLANNLSVAYTQTLNAFEIATKTDKPTNPEYRNLSYKIIRPSIKIIQYMFPEIEIKESEKTSEFELCLSDIQLKTMNVLIHNLLDNACSFANNKPVKIDVTQQKDELILSIVDSGKGIANDKIEKIWESGVTFRTDKSFRPESRGQGLPIVKRIIEELGWKISIVSSLNKGTKINININKSDWRKIK